MGEEAPVDMAGSSSKISHR